MRVLGYLELVLKFRLYLENPLLRATKPKYYINIIRDSQGARWSCGTESEYRFTRL
jgi:hypothetical protein